MRLLIKSAKIIDSESSFHKKKMDILIVNGRIEEIGSSLKPSKVDKEVKLEDLHVSRGWFDSSVNFGEPGYEERETISNGLKTAAKSGFTGVAINPETQLIVDDNGAVTSLLSKAAREVTIAYPIGALTRQAKGKELAELYDMRQAGAVAFGDYKKPVMNSNLLKLALQYAQNFGGLVQSYPQDSKIAGNGLVNEDENSTKLGLKGIPGLAEELHITRDLAILEYTGGKLHIPTISTAKAVKLIKEAKKKDLDVTCSVAIHNLIFTDDLLTNFDTRAKVLPPLRTKKDTAALFKGLKEGVIDMVTSDHFPVDIEHKKVEFEHALFGTIGIETAFGALLKLTGDLDFTISLLTKGKSRFGIKEAQIAEGSEADLSLFSPKGTREFTREEIFSTSKNSIFINSEISGKTYGIIAGDKWEIQE
ncbi:dihydroorotase [Antarcticibacterium sp. 1MA-6-2]|uniref:dihydroorotase n=1 Tax=Antarcticibacterium sp. 1MA-6-2 TaxID=2908210 RepID=UPI001F21BEDD|nr:dihydroorotase [Antarcticibacterium sp. 1MA-6-2]UJH91835.1 dihydroorotase [Antarcticibacterium sp. 1MA-6-2]